VFRVGEIYAFHLDFMWHMSKVQNGSLVVLVVSGSGTVGMRNSTLMMQALGSAFADHLLPDSHWIWIFTKGGKTLYESVVVGSFSQLMSSSVFSLSTDREKFIKDGIERKRWEMCHETDVLGTFCDKKHLEIIHKIPDKLNSMENILEDIPIILVAGTRLHYLHESISSLFNSPGFIKDNLHVFLGDTNNLVVEYLTLINVKYTKLRVHGKENFKLFQFYRSVYQNVADVYHNSKAAIFLDEDVLVAKDYFSLMNQLIPLLFNDDSIYCVTGHGSNLGEHLLGRENLVKRISVPVMWGYALSLEFIKEVLSKWSMSTDYSSMYDIWMYYEVVEYRECVTPEVSRTRHFGSGTNSQGLDMERTFMTNKFPTTHGIEITNLEEIPIENWKKHTIEALQTYPILYDNPCQEGLLDNLPNESYIFPFKMEILDDETVSLENQYLMGECLGFWGKSDGGWHGIIKELRFTSGHLIYAIGIPASPYSKYLNIEYENVWQFDHLSDQDKRKTMDIIAEKQNVVIKEIEHKYQKSKMVMHEWFI